eukprot:TRINITY_DN90_c0_g1_i1.p1 TRINITY_DN90_c0_g1~~TRINITY_DN90_c0_g1_i1.p1  ORF type:complete len:572 (-),score=64.19 TRINITY_DN90_c0_g1_i1:374-2089(-)
MFVGNILFLLVALFVFPMKEAIVVTPEMVNDALINLTITNSVGILVMMHYNAISNNVYETVKVIYDKLSNNTKEKEQLFASISHEIRNPLQTLVGAVELLQDSQQENASPVEICKNCCEIVLNLVSNILDLSKIAAKKMVLSTIPADLHELINKTLRITHARAAAKGVKLKLIDDPAFPPAIELDTQRMEQILLNLVTNAIKFTAKGKIVVKLCWIPIDNYEQMDKRLNEALLHSSWKETLVFSEKETLMIPRVPRSMFRPSLRKKSTEYLRVNINDEGEGTPRPLTERAHARSGNIGIAKIEVMDTGIGISKEGIKRLFSPYQQANHTISRNYGGTGLGLWISKNILALMKGDIKIKSRQGEGSNFMLAFPAKTCEEVKTFRDTFEEEKELKELKGKTFLLLDDNPDNQVVMEGVLQKYGVTSICRENGYEALEEYKENCNIDAVITDLRMPLMSGQAFIIELRKYEAQANRVKVPIVVVTAENSIEEKKLCLQNYGANEYLVKPIKQRDLMKAVSKVLYTHKKERVKRILVVDDDIISSKFLANILGCEGHASVVCHSVSEVIVITQYT